MSHFSIKNRIVGDGFNPLVIAEIGINHGGSIDEAIFLADSAMDAGAEVIKHQTHIIDDEMSEEAKFIIPKNANKSIFEIMDECSLSEKDEFHLMQYVNSRGRIFISTPFSKEAVERLRRFNIPAIKIGSGECNHYPLVKLISTLGKPVIMSTGMNSIESITPSVNILRNAGVPYALLHCTNIYPTPLEAVRLNAIPVLKKAFPDAVIGLSDHTTSNYTCFGAVALGASILERHFTDTMNRQGPDINCSMDPSALKELIQGANSIFKARGPEEKTPHPDENPTISFAFVSVVSTKEILPGEFLTNDNIWLRRPSGGDFGVKDYDKLIGRKAITLIKKNMQIKREQIL